MLTCKEASHLISEHQERPLSLGERIGLRLHLWICVNCRRFERQIALLRQAMRRLGRRALDEAKPEDLPADSRERIRKAIAGQDEDPPV